MANKKIQIIPPDGGYVDVLHPETTASQVIEETNKRFMTDAERTKLTGIAIGATNNDALNAHKADLANPHTVTKTQAGLGDVENYGIATQAEAKAGTVNNKYVTPFMVKEAIGALSSRFNYAIGESTITGSIPVGGTISKSIPIGTSKKFAVIMNGYSIYQGICYLSTNINSAYAFSLGTSSDSKIYRKDAELGKGGSSPKGFCLDSYQSLVSAVIAGSNINIVIRNDHASSVLTVNRTIYWEAW